MQLVVFAKLMLDHAKYSVDFGRGHVFQIQGVLQVVHESPCVESACLLVGSVLLEEEVCNSLEVSPSKRNLELDILLSLTASRVEEVLELDAVKAIAEDGVGLR